MFLITINDYQGDDAHIEVPEGTTRIASRAFAGHRDIASITLPETLRHIEDRAFQYCASLERIVLPEGLTSLGEWAFAGCYDLREVQLPSTLQDIPSNCFRGCMKLERIVVPEGVVSAFDNAFRGCTRLKEARLPQSLVYIDNSAFRNCKALETVVLSSNLKILGDRAFAGCTSLANIEFPPDVPDMGEEVFRDCPFAKERSEDKADANASFDRSAFATQDASAEEGEERAPQKPSHHATARREGATHEARSETPKETALETWEGTTPEEPAPPSKPSHTARKQPAIIDMSAAR